MESRSKIVICFFCGKEVKKSLSELKSENAFCSHSCSASYFNRTRKLDYSLLKEINCKQCGIILFVKRNDSNKLCSNCFLNSKPIKQCLLCKKNLVNITSKYKAKYCKSCRHLKQIETAKIGGRLSAAKQTRRSKNEIYFADLCKEHYNNILTNVPYFESKTGKWDADIILPDHKIAVLWNGIWHYKKIKEKHSLIQVQTRDKIKEDVIRSNGFVPYIITDVGSFNKEFVETQFEFFKFYVEHKTK